MSPATAAQPPTSSPRASNLISLRGDRGIAPRVQEVMQTEPLCVSPATTVRHAARLLAAHPASEAMVVDGEGRLLGVVSERDLIAAFQPTFAELRDAPSRSWELPCASRAARIADEPVAGRMVREPITLGPGERLGRAHAVMTTRGIGSLPVVADGRLLGTLSRAELCLALMGA